MKQAKWYTAIFLPALFITLLLPACENDLNKVKAISAMEVNHPTETTTDVDVIYSDSARVKAHMLTPLMIRHKEKITNQYYEMPKGVKIDFYDEKQNKHNEDPNKFIVCTVTSNYAITSNNDKIIELHKNVVVTNKAGDTFRSEELIWDQNKKLIFSNQKCLLNKVDGTALDGTSFTSNETFTDYRFQQGKGNIVTNGNLTQ
jgi:LPS export ABC transporter protein LptC